MRPHSFAFLVLALAACDCEGGKTHASGGVLSVPEASVDFGDVCPKPSSPDTKVATSKRSVHISNVGNALLYVNRFAVDDGAQFAFNPAAIPSTLEPGESAEVFLTFAPLKAGAVEATLTVEGDEQDKPAITVPLRGNGKAGSVDPVLALNCPGGKWSNDSCAGDSPNLWFADAPVKGSGEQVLVLGNGGCPPLEARNFKVTNADATRGTFALVEGQPSAIAVPGGGTAPLRLVFRPLVRDLPVAGTLTFETNAPDSRTVSLPLQGIGVEQALALAPLACDFSPLASPCTGTFTVTNTSSQQVAFASAALESGSPLFKIASAPAYGAMLAPAESAKVEVEYQPAIATGADTLVVTWSGGTSKASLRGGSPPVVMTDPADLVDFGDRKTPGTDYYQPITIQNLPTYNRQVPLVIQSVEIDPTFPSNNSAFSVAANPGDLAGCPAAPAPGTQVAVGQSVKACVKFRAPSGGGSFVASLLVRTNDPGWPDASPYLVSVGASTDCNRAPVAQVTALLGTPCPCSADAVCVSNACQATRNFQVSLSEGEVTLSAETSYDQVADASGACTVKDPAAVGSFAWSLDRKPATSQAALAAPLSPRTRLPLDREGLYVVTLVVADKTSLPSAPVTFSVTAVP